MSPLEKLPEPIFGNVLDQLVQMTGTKEVKNDADLSYILKYTCALARLNRKMNEKLNHSVVTTLFTSSLSRRFGEPSEYFAGVLNTLGARKWIWDLIKKKGDDRVYQIIRQIYLVASVVLIETKRVDPAFHATAVCMRKSFSYNTHTDSTKNCYQFEIGDDTLWLHTPIGPVKLVLFGTENDKEVGCSYHLRFTYLEQLVHRLDAVFIGMYGSCTYQQATSASMISHAVSPRARKIGDHDLKTIHRHEIKPLWDTQSVIIPNHYGDHAVYKIKKVGAAALPCLPFASDPSAKRGEKLLYIIWSMLERHRLGKDPLTKDLSSVWIKPRPKSRRTPCRIADPFFNELSEVCLWSIGSNCKKENDASRDLRRLLYQAEDHLAKQHNIDTSINVSWFILNYVTQNWKKAFYKDYPDVLFTESEEEYILFIKEKRLFRHEDILLRLLANLLGIRRLFDCRSEWKTRDSQENETLPLYAWVPKKELETVLKVWNLEGQYGMEHLSNGQKL